MKMEILLEPTSNKLMVERFDTSAGNPVREILLKLSLPDHRIFKDGGEGKMSFFLGLQILQSPRGIFINQSNYALEIIKQCGTLSSDPVNTPMVEKSKLDEDLQGKPVDPTYYRGASGKWSGGTLLRQNRISTSRHLRQSFALRTIQHLDDRSMD
ncbi:uncharacterized mitochondrial protein-like protein [Tanacetum coccineum]